MKHPSLAGMVEAIKVKMSREGMHRRFSVSAIEFMRRCSDFILNQKISAITSLRADLLRYFKRILIFDSSSWDIDPKLKNVLPGFGGSASEANCKLQTCYEYKRGELSFFCHHRLRVDPLHQYKRTHPKVVCFEDIGKIRTGLRTHRFIDSRSYTSCILFMAYLPCISGS